MKLFSLKFSFVLPCKYLKEISDLLRRNEIFDEFLSLLHDDSLETGKCFLSRVEQQSWYTEIILKISLLNESHFIARRIFIMKRRVWERAYIENTIKSSLDLTSLNASFQWLWDFLAESWLRILYDVYHS